MRRLHQILSGALLVAAALAAAAPTVYPTGTTLYEPAKAWNGYTVLSILDTPKAVVIDMNGRVVKEWADYNVSAGGPARVLPGGVVIATAGANPPHQEALALVARDFDGHELWRFDHNVQITPRDGEKVWSARVHHDWQRADFPAGYYSPSYTPKATGGSTLLLTHIETHNDAVAPVALEDDRLIEVDADGHITWEWKISDHLDAFRLDAGARAAIRSGATGARGTFDALHINSATFVGPNHWFDAGDARFAPENVIISSRQASFIAIIARDGKVAWQIGPDFSRSKEEQAIGQIIGQHHAHMIPKGLPGAGNLLVFDNGGSSGYGTPTSIAPGGQGIYARATSRVLEIDPVTLAVKWSYTSPNFYSTNISSAQRLPNGNTLIAEGAPGRVFEVTPEKQIVWEYMNPPSKFGRGSNAIYRAYRIPYDWMTRAPRAQEKAVHAPPAGEFVLPADQ
jgi:hypothetical protein